LSSTKIEKRAFCNFFFLVWLWNMNDQIERKRLAILSLLKEARTPVSSDVIADRLSNLGFEMSERTVRFYLKQLDEEGFTEYLAKQGRKLTPRGTVELEQARIHERLGFLSAQIDRLTYLMDFDLKKAQGNLVANISLIETKLLKEHWKLIHSVYKAGYSMGELVALFQDDKHTQSLGITIPPGFTAVATVCSITLNGILLAKGIPMYSRYGGLLEVIGNNATRFVALMTYDGTTIDPLELYIKAGLTDYLGVTQTGNGVIGAGFREIPGESINQLESFIPDMKSRGLGAILEIGTIGQPLFGIPASEGRTGVVVIGGLNPVATLEESSIPLYSRALSTLVPYQDFFHFDELGSRVSKLKN
jgi:repressor of nif and glnA expression